MVISFIVSTIALNWLILGAIPGIFDKTNVVVQESISFAVQAAFVLNVLACVEINRRDEESGGNSSDKTIISKLKSLFSSTYTTTDNNTRQASSIAAVGSVFQNVKP